MSREVSSRSSWGEQTRLARLPGLRSLSRQLLSVAGETFH